MLPLGTRKEDGVERLSQAAGLSVQIEYDKVFVSDVAFNRIAQSSGLESDYEITGLELNNSQPSKEWMSLPCPLWLIPVVTAQCHRPRIGPVPL